MEINYHLPDFLKHFRLYMVLTDYMRQKPENFRDGVKIGSVYGVFPTALWNGGRASFGLTDERTMKEVLKIYNDMGIPCRYTFTNPLITEEHLGDKFCNKMLELGNNGLNEVIVFSPALEEYIRKNYPAYKITASTCRQLKTTEAIEEQFKKDYNLVVLDYNMNNQFDELEKITQKNRCELLINACCQPNCQRRGDHYRSIGQSQLDYEKHRTDPILSRKPYEPKEFGCPYMKLNLYETVGFSTHISPESIYEKYVPMGFNQFKIEGRTVPDINVLENIVYYMVKPEYKDITRLELLTRLTAKTKYFR